jgi:phosphoribosylformylglycinamidine cyclo-ligase
VPEADLWHTFNLGVGFCLVVPPTALPAVLDLCRSAGHQAWELGVVAPGDPGETPLAGLPH